MRPKGPPGANTTHNRRARRGAARFWNWNRERDDDLQQRGVAVEMTTQRLAARRNGEHFELHILAAGGTEAVAVEVKTTLRPRDVKRFEEKLARIREWLRAYAGHRIYGAVAYLEADESVVRHAVRRGLFVIRATGSSASIVNDADFRPRAFP